MKKLFIRLSYLLFFTFLFTSCLKDNQIDNLVGKWEVISLYDNGVINPQNTDKQYILEFKSDSSVRLNLDVNNCFGAFETNCDNCIYFGQLGCTEICCDSEYADNLTKVIYEVSKYKIDFDILSLYGEGEIKLKWVE